MLNEWSNWKSRSLKMSGNAALCQGPGTIYIERKVPNLFSGKGIGFFQFSSVYLRIPTKHKILYQEYRDRKRRP